MHVTIEKERKIGGGKIARGPWKINFELKFNINGGS